MAPKKRSPPFNIQGSPQTKRSAEASDYPEPSTSPALPKSSRRRQQRQPSQAEEAISGINPSTHHFVDLPTPQQFPAQTSRLSSEGTDPESISRRLSTSSTMRTSSMPFEGPPQSTPTGRISKAKKGKRVHACAYEGCGKVFTRAEHRRRHELNHNDQPMFSCTRPNCRKAFHRQDLLARHQERHDLEHQLESQSGSGRHMTQLPDVPTSMPPATMSNPPTTQSAQRTSSGGMSIGSLVNPQTEYRYGMGTPAFGGFSRPVMPFSTGFPSDDSLYYTPESSQSPVSEQYGRYAHRQSISSSSSVAGFDPSQTSPLINGQAQWVPPSAPPNVLPTNMFDDHSYVPTSSADSSIPIPLTNLDGDEFAIIRRELSYAPGILSTHDGNGVPDAIRWDCLELYFQNFHPNFPIIHRPTFLPTKPSPLLASAMVAIGSQFDTRTDAKLYSLTLLEVAVRLLRRRDNITSRSRLADLQTVFLLEALSKYCARRIEVEMSARFRALFSSLDQARRTLSTSSLAVFRTLKAERSKEELTKAHKFWVDHETRRRILQAFSILDMQQMIFFEQPATVVQHGRTRLSIELARASMSLPSADELWNASPIEEWQELAKTHQHLEQTSVDPFQPQENSTKLDYFQMATWLQADPASLNRFCYEDHCIFQPLMAQDNKSEESLIFNKHAMNLIKHTPLRQLLIVSGESWIFGKKLENETDFQVAKQALRTWVNNSPDSLTALWHATKLLRLQINFMSSQGNSQDITAAFENTRMLHEPWCIYVASLVIWAHGLYPSLSFGGATASGTASVASAPISNHSSTSSSSGHPSLMETVDAAQEAQKYLDATDVDSVSALTTVDMARLGRMHGLLEIVRMQKVLPLMGGLMSEAERVLFRLVEGRSSLSHF